MPRMKLFIGVEGIAMRYSVAVAADENGRVLAAYRAEGEPLSFHTTSRLEFRSRLKELLRSLLKQMGLTLAALENASICLGVTGVTFPFDSEVDLPSEFRNLEITPGRLICTGDAETVVASHACTPFGGVILCHMGSTAYVSTDRPRRAIRYGGWGPAIGDEGSGFALGRGAVRLVGEEHDAGVKDSALWVRVRKWLGSPSTEVPEWEEAALRWRDHVIKYALSGYDLRTALFSLAHESELTGNWRIVASGLVIPLMLAWRDGHEGSDRLIRRAAYDLVTQYVLACGLVKSETVVGPIVLYGGVFNHNPDFCALVVDHLKQRISGQAKIITPSSHGTARPVIGSLLYALGSENSNGLQFPTKQVLANIFATAAASEYREALRND